MDKLYSALEQSIRLHAEVFGRERAIEQAASAGITISDSGEIIHISGNPMLVLLRLTRLFILDGKLAKLGSCMPLLAEMERLAAKPEFAELVKLGRPLGLSIDSPPPLKCKLEPWIKP